MSDKDALRSRLERIAQATAGADNLPPPAWWTGDVAAERQVNDDVSAGRVHFRTAHNYATSGIDALDEGNTEKAELCAWEAYHFLVTALLCRLRPSDIEVLHKPAQKRGRPRKK